MKICVRAECSPVLTLSAKGELAETARSSGSQLRSALATRMARSAPRIADVRVEAEGVVLPDDVAEELVVAPVVRRVDDPLVLPARPRVRAGGAEHEAERLDERDELVAALGDRRRHVAKRLHAPCLDLDLRRDQLAREEPRTACPAAAAYDLLEAVDHVERVGLEERELLLDRDREVRGRLEPLAGLAQELVGGNALLVAHEAGSVIEPGSPLRGSEVNGWRRRR